MDGDRDVHSALASVRILQLAQLPQLPSNPYSNSSLGGAVSPSPRPPPTFGSHRARDQGRLHDIVAVHLLETGFAEREDSPSASALDALALSSTGRLFRVLSSQCSRYASDVLEVWLVESFMLSICYAFIISVVN